MPTARTPMRQSDQSPTDTQRGLVFRNRQRTRLVDRVLFRSLVRWLLAEHFHAGHVELCFHLVESDEMTDLNAHFLGHSGSTDVIAFDYSRWFEPTPDERAGMVNARALERCDLSDQGASLRPFHGEIFISVDEAVAQARRFRTSWPAELVRYVIHGLLHLAGHEDRRRTSRQRMKREEDHLLRLAARRFRLGGLARRRRKVA